MIRNDIHHSIVLLLKVHKRSTIIQVTIDDQRTCGHIYFFIKQEIRIVNVFDFLLYLICVVIVEVYPDFLVLIGMFALCYACIVPRMTSPTMFHYCKKFIEFALGGKGEFRSIKILLPFQSQIKLYQMPLWSVSKLFHMKNQYVGHGSYEMLKILLFILAGVTFHLNLLILIV